MLRCQSTVASSEDGWTRIWVSHSRPCDTGAPQFGAHQVLKETRNSCTTSLQTDKARNSGREPAQGTKKRGGRVFQPVKPPNSKPSVAFRANSAQCAKTIKYILINNVPSRHRARQLSATPDDYVPRQIQLGFVDDFLGMRLPEVGRWTHVLCIKAV